MFKYIFRNFGFRLVFALLAAWPASFLTEVIFSLQYDRYVIYQDLDSYLFTALAIFLFSEIAVLFNRFLDRKFPWIDNPVRRLSVQFLLQAILALVIVSGGRILFILIFRISGFILLADEITIALLTFFLVLVLNLVDFSIIMMRQWRDSRVEAEKYRKESAEFEFEMLRAQVNPHFLFNSLNTLSSLVYEDQDKAAAFIRKLSDVYRYVLDNRKNELISIADEMTVLEAYMYLLELRFAEKLEVSIKLTPGTYERTIAPLTLQMLIENAVKHNIISKDEPLRIDIFDEEDYIVVRNVLQLKQLRAGSTGMGLQNIRSRYNVISGKDVIVRDDNETFTVKIPMI